MRRACPKCGLLHGPERRCYVDVLLEALAGVELAPRDVRLVRWLAGFDEDTVSGVVSLFRRLRGVRS